MDTKLPAPFQQKVPAHTVKSLLEINKHDKQWLRMLLCRVYEVLEGENSIQGAVARPEATLCWGPKIETGHQRLQPLVCETIKRPSKQLGHGDAPMQVKVQ
jgi:hypothetical protein